MRKVIGITLCGEYLDTLVILNIHFSSLDFGFLLMVNLRSLFPAQVGFIFKYLTL